MCEINTDNVCDVWRESLPRARKHHRCCVCLTSISPGETYFSVFAVFEGEQRTEKSCLACAAMWRWFCDHHGGGPSPLWFAEALDECLDMMGDLSVVNQRRVSLLLVDADAAHRRDRARTLRERDDEDVRTWRVFIAAIKRRQRIATRASTSAQEASHAG